MHVSAEAAPSKSLHLASAYDMLSLVFVSGLFVWRSSQSLFFRSHPGTMHTAQHSTACMFALGGYPDRAMLCFDR